MLPARSHLDYHYTSPIELRSGNPQINRVMIIGSCLTTALIDPIRVLSPECRVDHILMNGPGRLPDDLPAELSEYQFQIVQPPIRFLINDRKHLALSFLDIEGHRNLFVETVELLRLWLAGAMRWNRESRLLTFVPNFLLPQKNLMGRMMPRYDLRNTTFFFEELNRELHKAVGEYENAYIVDLDEITSNVGRRTIRDDSVWSITHGAFLGNGEREYDQQRLEVPGLMSSYYGCYGGEVAAGWWQETLAMYRVLQGADAVKLVVVDLDDTLWRGIAAEGEHARGTLEGWPHGFIEALCFLKKRGVILAINSKNDEGFVKSNWDVLVDGLIKFDDFAIRKINWLPKVENMAAIMHEANLLPKSVVFIDDNPVERTAMSAAYPEIRVLGPDLYYLRRILLWSAETQVPFISDESNRRTELIQAQVERDEVRKAISREEFLAGLELKIHFSELAGRHDAKAKRALELVNKTNQFNTTAVRWSESDFLEALDHGTIVYVFSVEDRFSNYGQVGTAIVEGATIKQFVMSCRVAGLEVDTAAIAWMIKDLLAKGRSPVSALYLATTSNHVARDMLMRSGFRSREEGGEWVLEQPDAPAEPAHVSITSG